MFDVSSKLLDRLVTTESGCQEFTGALDTSGYGIVWVDGSNRGAHKIAFVHFKGPIPEGKWILHTCDNRACCNPDHLYAGTRQDNVDDMHSRNRAYIRKGSEVNTSRLTAQEVTEIRNMAAKGYSQRDLGEMFSVSHAAIGRVIRREVWRHVA